MTLLRVQADLRVDVQDVGPPSEVFDQHGSCVDRRVAGSHSACGG